MDLDHFAGLLSAQLRRPAVPVDQQLATLKRLSFRFSPELEATFWPIPSPTRTRPTSPSCAVWPRRTPTRLW